MTTSVANSRSEILAEVRAKRARALRFAGYGSPREQEYWLHIAGRMTVWIEHLEESAGAQNIPKCPPRPDGAHPAIDLPPSARRSRGPALPTEETAPSDLRFDTLRERAAGRHR